MKTALAVLLVIALLTPQWAFAAEPRLSKDALTVAAGSEKTLAVKNYNGKVTWRSENPKVAKVSKTGTVTGVKAGVTRVTATLKTGETLTCAVTVKAVLNAGGLTLARGEEFAFSVLGFSGKKAYSSTRESVAEISAGGLVRGLKEGTSWVICTLPEGENLKCKVTVSEKGLTKTKAEIPSGGTLTLAVEGYPGRKVAWSSSDESVATVKKGTVSAVSDGDAVITASVSKGPVLKAKITVLPRLNRQEATLTAGDSVILALGKAPARKVLWSSSDPDIAAVDKKGAVTARRAGEAVIRAEYGGYAYTCAVTVRPEEIGVPGVYNSQDGARAVVFTAGQRPAAYVKGTGYSTLLVNKDSYGNYLLNPTKGLKGYGTVIKTARPGDAPLVQVSLDGEALWFKSYEISPVKRRVSVDMSRDAACVSALAAGRTVIAELVNWKGETIAEAPLNQYGYAGLDPKNYVFDLDAATSFAQTHYGAKEIVEDNDCATYASHILMAGGIAVYGCYSVKRGNQFGLWGRLGLFGIARKRSNETRQLTWKDANAGDLVWVGGMTHVMYVYAKTDKGLFMLAHSTSARRCEAKDKTAYSGNIDAVACLSHYVYTVRTRIE